MDRGDNYKYLNGTLKLDDLKEKILYIYFMRSGKKATCLELFLLYIKIIICSNNFITV